MVIGDRPILLVEDNPMDVDLTLRAFSKRQIRIPLHIARDGEAALDYFQSLGGEEASPLVVLLDLKLPKLGGLEVLDKLKKHPRFGRIPVVVLSTSTEERDIQQAYDSGANSYIAKPVDFDDFTQIVEQIKQYWCDLNIPPD